jgi:hypothetical protein
VVVRSALSVRAASVGRSGATQKTSNPLPSVALVAGALTVCIRVRLPNEGKKVANDGTI